MKKFLVIAAAGGALAVGVPAALAATDTPTTDAPVQNVPVQTQESTPAPQQERPNRDDCPEKDGNGNGGASTAPQGGADSSATTPSPEL